MVNGPCVVVLTPEHFPKVVDVIHLNRILRRNLTAEEAVCKALERIGRIRLEKAFDADQHAQKTAPRPHVDLPNPTAVRRSQVQSAREAWYVTDTTYAGYGTYSGYPSYAGYAGYALSPTRTDVNAATFFARTILARTLPSGDLTKVYPESLDALDPRGTPVTADALLAWGRALPRTGIKKMDLDV